MGLMLQDYDGCGTSRALSRLAQAVMQKNAAKDHRANPMIMKEGVEAGVAFTMTALPELPPPQQDRTDKASVIPKTKIQLIA